MTCNCRCCFQAYAQHEPEKLVRPFTTIARPMQEALAFRSKGSIGVVVRRGAKARMTQPPLRLRPIRGSSW